jgi:cell division protein ZapA
MRSADGVTRVNICDQCYQIKGNNDSHYIQELAAYVDKKMREIAESSQTADSLKVAVMAALNISDELFQERENAKKLDAVVYERSSECSRQLDQVLKR